MADETAEPGLLQRRGKFTMALAVVQDNPEVVVKVMAGLLIIRCELKYDDRMFEYGALSEHFDPIEEGELAPSYDVSWDEGTETATWSRVP